MNLTRKFAVALAATALTAGLTAAAAPVTAAPQGVAAECGVRSDGRLHCGNNAGAKGYEHRSYGSAVRGQMNTTFSWFQCWGRGDNHAGGNNIWYWTQLDNGQWGNMPAVDVHTSVDPAPGLREC
ncbi:hypothetical protein GCM10010329_73050 [Streptomyces spiroverticillatus]|uniref:Secreted protein n=1 Tax=Streptomyces finlayi TaxID=67296 RepID=A0A918X6H6_9ACTN|nr:hypothetical protein [Streptomyces finlayi]GHA39321.1 hypothetical protein GCM10010329_73050 [Streptomyces spiroverticillatus]GHD14202.1 hypothetical protein GCM10010334_73210 [Streptomyces finlayi]